MPFLDHLEELRWRILKGLLALIVAFSVSFTICMHYDMFKLLTKPIVPFLKDGSLVYTHPFTPFTVLMQIAMAFAIVLASPVVGYQVWAFLSPALTTRERRTIVPVLAGAAVLFLLGVSLAVFIFLPQTMALMKMIPSSNLQPMITADDYFSLLMQLSLAFGAVFELPILILTLTALGLMTPKLLVHYRRHAFVALLVICEIITPGDLIISTLMLFIPVYGLYEFSILLSRVMFRKRQKRETEAQTIGAGASA